MLLVRRGGLVTPKVLRSHVRPLAPNTPRGSALPGSFFAGGALSPERLARARRGVLAVIDAVGAMMLRDGFFHADTHPGNIMLLDDGRVCLLDFGQCVAETRRCARSVDFESDALCLSRCLYNRSIETN